MCRHAVLGLLLTAAASIGSLALSADERAGRADLAKSLPGAVVTLQQGLIASAVHGRPISAKFAIDGGQFSLSVYTAKSGRFFELAVDCRTGKIIRIEPIRGGDGLLAAQSQASILVDFEGTLEAAVDRAEHQATGYRAVSVTPEGRDTGAFAVVVLVRGTEYKSLDEPLSEREGLPMHARRLL